MELPEGEMFDPFKGLRCTLSTEEFLDNITLEKEEKETHKSSQDDGPRDQCDDPLYPFWVKVEARAC